uniref:Protein kinase domain-containing protein n=1 Tax=Romanomermis culicivorax TaxID=13658 RepID=A0A915KL72_ROMCU
AFVVDFGLSRFFIDDEGRHRPEREKAPFRGTLRYCSINAHKRKPENQLSVGNYDAILWKKTDGNLSRTTFRPLHSVLGTESGLEFPAPSENFSRKSEPGPVRNRALTLRPGPARLKKQGPRPDPKLRFLNFI